MNTITGSPRRAALTVGLVIVVLAAGAVVARAATHAIAVSDGRFTATCSACHAEGPAGLTPPAAVVLPPGHEETSDTPKSPVVIDVTRDAPGRGATPDEARDAVVGRSGSGDARSGDPTRSGSGPKRMDAHRDTDEHETVHEETHERDRDGDEHRRDDRRDPEGGRG